MNTNVVKSILGGAAALAVAGCIAAVGITATTPQASAGEAQEVSPSQVIIPNSATYRSWVANVGEYPDQVLSFFDGADEVEQADGKVHSHSMLFQNVSYGDESTMLGVFGSTCIQCKSTYSLELFEENGFDAFTMPWWDVAEQADWWDCGLCHTDGVPGGELAPGGVMSYLFLDTLNSTVVPENAVCGQCHNYIGATYGRGGLMNKIMSGEVDAEGVDPHRYGFGPEELMQAALEDGYVMAVDEATGIQTFQANHPEVEILQGSVHDMLGVTCVDCHMPVMTNAEGETYTSHNASASPLENEAALEYCITCHASQGIDTPEAMTQFVLDAQAHVAELEATFYEKQGELRGLIAAAVADGTVDEELLQQVRDDYTLATWMVRYADGGSEIRGQKIAHNPAGIVDYIERATVMMENGIEALS